MKSIGILTFAVMLVLSSPVAAQNQENVPLYLGELTVANAERFTTTIANHVDEVVGLQISFSTLNAGDVLTDESPSGGAYISFANSYSAGVQLNIPDAYWRHGQWIADGFYTVKYGGMGQGIMGYQLRPADEASIRLSQKPIVRINVENLPTVQRQKTAD